MGDTTISISNHSKPAPKWFRKLKRAVSISSDSVVVLMLAAGFADNSFAILIVRVGISGAFNFVETLLADPDDEQK